MFSPLAFKGKNVFITGHTGFKGAWLTQWLLEMGANVTGFSLPPAYPSSLYEILNHTAFINDHHANILDFEFLSDALITSKPDYIFHLAAQAIVSSSYSDPLNTINSNVLGTSNLLQAVRTISHPCVLICITSDKAYFNSEWSWGYRENDRLGGTDIYSGSKGAAELIISSFFHSFLSSPDCPIRLGVARAGNVIGGGDWASDRLIPDIYSCWYRSQSLEVRSPFSTRPWQHVLEPLCGYLTLADNLSRNPKLSGEAFNFGPSSVLTFTVKQIIEDLFRLYPSNDFQPFVLSPTSTFKESSLLKLNCDKAYHHLSWESTLSYNQMLSFVSDWYVAFQHSPSSLPQLTSSQISSFTHFTNVQA